MPRNHVPPIDVASLRPLAEGLARRIARQDADVDDLVQTGLLAWIVDQRRLTARSQTRTGRLRTEHAAWALARVVLRRAMLGYYGMLAERKVAQTASLDDQNGCATLVRFATSDSHQRQNDLLEMHDYLDALERACGRTARRIAENLIAPRGECAVRLTIEIRRKRATQRRGYDHGHPRVRLSQRAVRDAMEMDKREWDRYLAQVRGFTREWLGKTG